MGRSKKQRMDSPSTDSDYVPSDEDERQQAEVRTKKRNEPLRVFQRLKKAVSRRGSGTSTSAPPEPEPVQVSASEPVHATSVQIDAGDTIVFRNEYQQLRYESLRKREMLPTRFADVDLLRKLGLEEDVKNMFNNLGLMGLWGVDWRTYPRYVLEFLSSLSGTNPSNNEGTLTFRLDGNEHKMKLSQLSRIYKFHEKAVKDKHESFPHNEFWKEISGEVGEIDEDTGEEKPVYNASSSKASKIVNPSFRYFHRVMSNTIQARGDSQGNVRLTELFFMWAALRYKGQVDMGSYFLQQLMSTSTRGNGKMFIGGMLTPLFEYFKCDLSQAIFLPGSRLLDQEAVVQAHFVVKEGSILFWKNPRLQLPNTELTSLKKKENWLLAQRQGGISSSQIPEDQTAGAEIAMIDMDQLISDMHTQTTPATHMPDYSDAAGPFHTSRDTPMPEAYHPQATGGSFDFTGMTAFMEEYRSHRARQDEQIREILAAQAVHGQILQRLEHHFFPPAEHAPEAPTVFYPPPDGEASIFPPPDQ